MTAPDKRKSVGWYGIPGSRRAQDHTKVHIVVKGKPICGSQLRDDMEFQWCSWDNMSYVECERCRSHPLARALVTRARKGTEANIVVNAILEKMT